MPKLLKIVFTFKFHPLHAKISTPTGTPVPDEKVKELSSYGPGLGPDGPGCPEKPYISSSLISAIFVR